MSAFIYSVRSASVVLSVAIRPTQLCQRKNNQVNQYFHQQPTALLTVVCASCLVRERPWVQIPPPRPIATLMR